MSLLLTYDFSLIYPVILGVVVYFSRLFYRPRVIGWCEQLDPEANAGYDLALEEVTDLAGFRSAGNRLSGRKSLKTFLAIYAGFLLYVPEILFYMLVLKYLISNVWLFIWGILLGGLILFLFKKVIKEKV